MSFRAAFRLRPAVLAAAFLSAVTTLPAVAQEKVLNLYSARHYQTDEALYTTFTKVTGIKINRIEAGDEALLERLTNEGANSPADVVLLVDAARLAKAQAAGLFAPVNSKLLNERIPPNLRAADGSWFGFSTRARVIVYNKANVQAADVDTYEKLADPKNKGKVCTRSGAHPYQLSLAASLIEHLGEAKTEAWAKGVVANFARAPRGGDTDQIKGVASGECGVALTNSYYLARLMRSEKADDKDVVSKIGIVWPNQANRGTHLNISGGAMAKSAKNREAAVQFLEYLSGDFAQRYFADGNNEWPVVKGVKVNNPALDQMGTFKADKLPVAALLKNSGAAQKLMDRAGYR
jgi:iron(III) transport system substrate-binding protein